VSSARLSYSVATAAEATGLSRSHLHREIKAGRLRARRSGQTEDGEPAGKYVILAPDLEAYLAELVDA
jgi:excisionase family DNA binding protein